MPHPGIQEGILPGDESLRHLEDQQQDDLHQEEGGLPRPLHLVQQLERPTRILVVVYVHRHVRVGEGPQSACLIAQLLVVEVRGDEGQRRYRGRQQHHSQEAHRRLDHLRYDRLHVHPAHDLGRDEQHYIIHTVPWDRQHVVRH